MENVLEICNSLEMNELHRAVQENRAEGVQFLIANGADIANTIDDGQTPLHLACSLNLPNITKELLKNKPRDELRQSINAKTVDTGTAALHLAARNDSLENARLLLSHGAQFDIRDNDGEPPRNFCSDKSIGDLLSSVGKLFDVVSSGNDQAVLDALDSCARDDLIAVMYARNSQDRTAMQMALGMFDLNAIGKIVDFRIKKVKQDPWQPGVKLDELMRHSKATRLQLNRLEKYNPRKSGNLIMDSYFQEIIVSLLRESHALLEAYKEQRDPSLADQPLLIIIEESLEFFGSWKSSKFIENERVGMMLWKDASFIASTMKVCIIGPMQLFMRLVYTSELLRAAERNDFALVKQCLTGHPNLNEVDVEGRTALRHAFIHRNYEMAKMLLRLGANPASDRCCQEEPFLRFALRSMMESMNRIDVELVLLMFDRVRDDELDDFVNAKSYKNDSTALEWASDSRTNFNLVRFLLSKGASFRYTPQNHDIGRLEEVTRQSFCQARDGRVKELVEKMEKLNVLVLLAVTGTRNEEGQTLEQVVEMSGHVEAAKQIRKLLSSKRAEQCKSRAAEFFEHKRGFVL